MANASSKKISEMRLEEFKRLREAFTENLSSVEQAAIETYFYQYYERHQTFKESGLYEKLNDFFLTLEGINSSLYLLGNYGRYILSELMKEKNKLSIIENHLLLINLMDDISFVNEELKK